MLELRTVLKFALRTRISTYLGLLISIALTSGVADQTFQALPLVWPPNMKMILPAGTVFGTLPGAGSVTPTGEYRYELPIEVPPGRLGMQPHLSLAYSSRSGNGLLGMGWSLEGISAIKRCAKTVATEGFADRVHNDDAKDAFCWDGRKLVPLAAVSGSATQEFRTEEDKFAKIVATFQKDRIVSFSVWTKDGLILTFANSLTDTSCGSAGSTWAYPLIIESDRSGNAIRYAYDVVSAGEYHPCAISYTWAGNQAAQRTIRFRYEGRQDPIFAYEAGVRFSTNRRLIGIDCSAPNPVAPSIVWSYALEYKQSPGSVRSLLSKVTRKGALGGLQLAKEFAWGSTAGPIYGPGTGKTPQYPWAPGPNQLGKMIVADFNHDGKDEILREGWELDYTPAGQSPLSGHIVLPGLGDPGTTGATMRDARVGDIDGSGSIQLIAPTNRESFYVAYRWDESKQDFVQNGVVEPDIYLTEETANLQIRNPLYLVDLDGDGLVDIVKGDYSSAEGGHDWDSTREPALPAALAYTWSVRWNHAGVWGPKQTFLNAVTNQGGFQNLHAPLTGGSHDAFTTNDGSGRSTLYFGSSWCSSTKYIGYGPIDSRYEGVSVDPSGGFHVVTDNNSLYCAKSPSPSMYTAFADMNGDGQEDNIDFDPAGKKLCITHWGQGDDTDYLTNPNSKACAILPNADKDFGKLLVFDMDADGRDDVLLLHLDQNRFPDGPGYRVFMDATGTLQTSFLANAPYLVGDFDGDGRLDVIVGDGNGNGKVQIQDTSTTDILASVSDEGAALPIESVKYSYTFAAPGHYGGNIIYLDPGYPYQAIRHGINVVREHDIYQGDDIGTYVRVLYSYAGPTFDLHGRGFLGFFIVDRWEPDIPAETITYFNNLSLDNTTYPGVIRPGAIYHITPIVGQQFNSPSSPMPKSAHARITRWEAHYEVDRLNGGRSFFARLSDWSLREGEQDVLIDAGDVALHTRNTFDSDTPSPFGPSSTYLRFRKGSYTYDAYGNLTGAQESTAADVSSGVSVPAGLWSETQTTYFPPDTTNWLVGLPKTRLVTSGNPGSKPVARRTDYVFTSGLLAQVLIEKGNPDPTIPVTYTYGRNADGAVTSVTASASGVGDRAIFTSYDDAERIFTSRRWNSLGHTETFLTHPALGVRVAARDFNGVVTLAQFDEFGRMRSGIAAGGATSDVTYAERLFKGHSNGVSMTRNGSDGSAESVEFDVYGRPITEGHKGFDGTWIYRRNTYDSLGRLIQWSRPGFNAPAAAIGKQRWDSLNRLLERITPDGADWTYETTFSRLKTTDPASHVRYVDLDVDSRVIHSVQFPPSKQPITTTYEYGDFGALSTITDAKKNKIAFQYDQRGRRRFTLDPDAGTTQVQYNGLGDVTAVYPATSGTQYLYDVLGRLTQAQNSDGITQFSWDSQAHGLGKPAKSISPDGVVHDFGYDELGRAATQTWTIGGSQFTVGYQYDALGRQAEITYPAVPGQTPFAVALGYNTSGFLNTVSASKARVRQFRPYWTTLAMNSDGQVTSGEFGNGIAATRSFDLASGRMDKLVDGKVLSYIYQYDSKGRESASIDSVNGRVESFVYDELDRLSKWTVASGGTRTGGYAFDDLGNLTSEMLNGSSIGDFQYGQNGSGPHALTTSPAGALIYDVRGRLVKDPSRQIAYTAFDLPKTVTALLPSGISKVVVPTQFSYDAEQHRVLKSRPADDTETLSLAGLYERRKQGAQTLHVYYLPGPEGVLAQVTIDEASKKQTLEYLHHDLRGSASVTTSETGSLKSQFYFQPFGGRADMNGNALSADGQSVKLGFDGLRHDDELGLIDQRGRVYDPTIRRFLTPDPHVTHLLDGQSYNAYSYVRNDPVNRKDPSGFDDCDYCPFDPGPDPVPDPLGSGGPSGSGGNTGGTSSAPAVRPGPAVQQVPSSTPIPSMPAAASIRSPSSEEYQMAMRMNLAFPPAVSDIAVRDLPQVFPNNFGDRIGAEGAVMIGLLATAGLSSAIGLAAGATEADGVVLLSGKAPLAMGVVGSIGYVATDPRLVDKAVEGAEEIGPALENLAANPAVISGELNPGFLNLTRLPSPPLLRLVHGKAAEVMSLPEVPGFVRLLGRNFQPEADAIVRVGSRLIPVDLTTWGQLEQHLARPYYQGPAILWLHTGAPDTWGPFWADFWSKF